MIALHPWCMTDADALRPMILACLTETYEAGADFVPDQHNVELLLKIGMQWAAAGEPTLIAFEDAVQPVGYCLWGGSDVVFHTRHRICAGLGTFVIPSHRRQHVAVILRTAAAEIARERGYQVVDGEVYSEAGLRSSIAAGFVVSGQHVSLRL